MKQLLKDKLKKNEAKAAAQPHHEGGGAKLKQVK